MGGRLWGSLQLASVHHGSPRPAGWVALGQGCVLGKYGSPWDGGKLPGIGGSPLLVTFGFRGLDIILGDEPGAHLSHRNGRNAFVLHVVVVE